MSIFTRVRFVLSCSIICAMGFTLANGENAFAVILFEDDFNSYSDAALVGQGGWLGDAGLTVASGELVLGNTGTSVNNPLSAAHTAGQTIYFSMDVRNGGEDDTYNLGVNLSDDTSTAIANSANNAIVTISGNKLNPRINTGGGNTQGTGPVPVVGTTYQLVGRLEFNASGTDEVLTMWIDPTDEGDAASATIMDDLGWTQVTHAGINFSGWGGTTPTPLADNLVIATTFNEAAGIASAPEPSTLALAAFALIGLGTCRRRRKQ